MDIYVAQVAHDLHYSEMVGSEYISLDAEVIHLKAGKSF